MVGHIAPRKSCEQDASETRWQPGSALHSHFQLPSCSSLSLSLFLRLRLFRSLSRLLSPSFYSTSLSLSHMLPLFVSHSRVLFFVSYHAFHLLGLCRKTKHELIMKMIALDGQRRAVSIREADILRALHHPHIVRCWNGILERGRAEASVGDVSFTSE